MPAQTNTRILALDYLRIFAAFAVVLLHTASAQWASMPPSSLSWQAMNLYDSAVRWAVPVFVMLSGSLLLPRGLSLKRLFTRYIPRLGAAFLLWSLVYSLVEGGSIRQIAVGVLRGAHHMWYLPMLIGLYLWIPVLSKLLEDRRLTRYFLVLTFVFSFVITPGMTWLQAKGPAAEALYTHCSYMAPSLGYAFYFVLGGYLRQLTLRRRQLLAVYALGILGFLITAGLTALVSWKRQIPTDWFYDHFTGNVLLEAVGVFLWFSHWTPRRERKWVTQLSGCTFGIYLVHVLVLDLLAQHLGLDARSFPTVFAIPVTAVLAFGISLAISWALGKVPLLRRLVS